MSILRALFEVAEALEKAGRDAATPDEGVAGRGMTEPPGTHSPMSLPPVSGRSILRPPGSGKPWSS